MRYTFIAQERDNYCVSACLQMILLKRELAYQNQPQIHNELKGNAEGVALNGKSLENFIRSNNYFLHCLELPVRYSQLKEFEELVKQGLDKECDILVGVAYEQLTSTTKEINHAILIEEYNSHSNEVSLIDPARELGIKCPFSTLIRSLFISNNAFYFFHSDNETLKRIKEKYF